MDGSLLSRVSTGDSVAVEECIRTYGRLIWALSRRLSAMEADAEDAVQEIFVDLWRSAGSFDPSRSSEATFVGMIARRRLIDRLRASRRQPVMEELGERLALPSSTFEQVERTAEAKQVLAMLEELGDDRRKALLLAICDGLTHAEVAEKLRIPLGTVKSHVRRGLEQIRQKLRIVIQTRQMDAAQ